MHVFGPKKKFNSQPRRLLFGRTFGFFHWTYHFVHSKVMETAENSAGGGPKGDCSAAVPRKFWTFLPREKKFHRKSRKLHWCLMSLWDWVWVWVLMSNVCVWVWFHVYLFACFFNCPPFLGWLPYDGVCGCFFYFFIRNKRQTEGSMTDQSTAPWAAADPISLPTPLRLLDANLESAVVN